MDSSTKHKLICDIIDKLEKDYGHNFHGIRSEVYNDLSEIIEKVEV